jgi:hypothetical protein
MTSSLRNCGSVFPTPRRSSLTSKTRAPTGAPSLRLGRAFAALNSEFPVHADLVRELFAVHLLRTSSPQSIESKKDAERYMPMALDHRLLFEFLAFSGVDGIDGFRLDGSLVDVARRREWALAEAGG